MHRCGILPIVSILERMIDYSDRGVVWYAMKTVYKKELKAKEYLDSRNIESFIPMTHEVSMKGGCRRVVAKPAIHNLIFVKVDLAQLKEIKMNLNYLHNRLMTEGGVSMPIIVPMEQMDQFIDAMTNHFEDITHIDLETSHLEKGTPVKITGGKFKGYEGELQRIKGKRDRRVHVNLKGVAAYSFEVEAGFVERV